MNEFGTDKLADLIAVYREGISREDALQRALGVSTDELDARWKASLGYAGDQAPSGGLARRTPSEPTAPWSWPSLAPLLASGLPVMALAAVLAIAAGVTVVVRTRRGSASNLYEG
jgi:hypothetical protein